MGFVIKVWIPVDVEDPQQYDTKEQAEKDIESLRLMQPENKYEVMEAP